MTEIRIPLSCTAHLPRDPLAAIAVSDRADRARGQVSPVGRSALARLRRSRRGRWALAVRSGAVAIALAVLAARHFATTSWPLSGGQPGLLVAAGLLLLLAQALKAYGWGRLFTPDERPRPLALAAGNGGAALIGLVLPGRFDDAMRVAVVRRYPGCPAGVRALCLSLVMLGLIDASRSRRSHSPPPCVPAAGIGVRVGLAVVAVAGVAAAALILALPRLAASKRASRFRLGRWLSPRTTSRRRASEAWAARVRLLARPGGRRSSCSSARSGSASRSRSHSCFSTPARRPRRCRSARRARPRRSAEEPPP